MYNKIIVITNIRYIPSNILVDLARMYKYICVMYITSIGGIKTSLDTAYTSNDDGTFNPVPVYVYTGNEVHVLNKARLRRYCNGLGVQDVVFKVHV